MRAIIVLLSLLLTTNTVGWMSSCLEKTACQQWRRSGVFTVNFEHILHLVLVFLLLTLNMQLLAGLSILFYET